MSDPGIRQARIRRAPRLPVFLVVGAVLGVVVALVLTAVGNIDPAVGFGPTFGYLCLWGIPIGVLVGALVALIVDRVSRRRARVVAVERASVAPAPAESAPAGSDPTESAPAGSDPGADGTLR